MDKLVIKPTTKVAKMDALGRSQSVEGASIQYGPQPVVTYADGTREHFIGMDFVQNMRGQQFDEIDMDPRVKVRDLKMAQKTFLAGLLKPVKK